MANMKGSNRNRIFGSIGVVWGGLMIVRAFATGFETTGSGGYAAGQTAGIILGFFAVCCGFVLFDKRIKNEPMF